VEETIIEEGLKVVGSTDETRKAQDAAEYAKVVREVGKENGVAVLDVWTAFMEKAGWKAGDAVLPGSKELGKDAVLADLLYDGELLKPGERAGLTSFRTSSECRRVSDCL